MKKSILTIAGFDPTNGAGVGNDVKLLSKLGIVPFSVVTAITSQNTKKVEEVYPVSKEILRSQLSVLLSDIKPDGIKIGMLATRDIAMIVWGEIRKVDIPVVFDPVIRSTGGDSLFLEEDYKTFLDFIIPSSTLVTPNIPEAEVLTGMVIKNKDDMSNAAKKLLDKGVKSVLIKGGHLENKDGDLYMDENTEEFIYNEKRFDFEIHGTGCSLATLVLYYLIQGKSTITAVKTAREMLIKGIDNSYKMGNGSNLIDFSNINND